MSRLRRVVIGLLLIVAGVTNVSAEVRLPLPSALKDLSKSGIRLDAPVHLTADTLSYDEDTGVALAEGNVELALGTRSMRADRIRYDSATGEADLSGKVQYKDADEEFAFDRITINLDSETGVLYNGTIRISSSSYLIASSKIEKTGKSSFLIEKGMLTTCPCDPEPDWKFEVRRARVTLDQYAIAKDITFRIRGVPVLWLPWGAFPVKMTRQSGLLLPNFSSNRSRGYTLQLPYYQVINRWSDATVTLDAMSRRGYRPEAEYRFALNPESQGALRATMFRDRVDDRKRARYYGENIFRSGPFTANAILEVPTDPRYYLDLVDLDALRSMRHARSEGFASAAGVHSEHAISILWNKDLQEIPGPDNTVQRMPEYTMTLLPAGIPTVGVDLSGEVSATRFQRRDGFDEVRARGFGEVSRAIPLYRSFTLVPYLFADVLGTRFERSPADGPSDLGRFVPGGGATLSADARRDFSGRALIHTAGVSAGYRYVPKIRQDDLPATDRWSRLAPQSQFLLTFSQRLLGVKDAAAPKEFLSFHIEWAYDLGGKEPSGSPYVDPLAPYVRALRDQIDTGSGRPPKKNDAPSDVYAKVALTPFERWRFQGEALFDPAENSFTVGAVSGEYKKDDNHRVLAEYRLSRDLAEDVRGTFAWPLLRWLHVQAQANYSVRNAYLSEGAVGVSVFPRSDCWNIGFTVERKTQPDDTSVRLSFGLKGIGSVGK
ncbi:LPS-assembly protein LptD [Candidatus Deferrimicrobium sp.]|uniref:LPS-assembly protein LptD n=1 Tax=Candidatus Deferrimicrobium sp. TaxID=3060586 RepID=UPI002720D642|nr:LPS assembly protein LptD [Candidatus Deferrimicrobium sp.]MDO8738163.1 LPS assembly protein LptD [Candidatus Deferrimicrobium sp.]